MPQAGNSFIVELKPSHLGWGTYRNTNTREPIYGEGYIKIPLMYARSYNIYNSNQPGANTLYTCHALNGVFSGILLAQGCSNAGDIYAKQFAEEGSLKGIGNWYQSVVAQVGRYVEVVFKSPTSLTIRYF